MAVVYFDRPKSKVDPDRPANALLMAQVHHLRQAEKDLPPKYQSGIFSHAIHTEGEVARYAKSVTEAIHKAHRDAARERARRQPVFEIAAAAEGANRKPRRKKAKKPAKTKSSGKK